MLQNELDLAEVTRNYEEEKMAKEKELMQERSKYNEEKIQLAEVKDRLEVSSTNSNFTDFCASGSLTVCC